MVAAIDGSARLVRRQQHSTDRDWFDGSMVWWRDCFFSSLRSGKNLRMCKALLPGDDESMSAEAIWETLPMQESYRSVHSHMQPALSNGNALEHLLVYAPSGNVTQYELLPSMGGEHGDSASRAGTGLLVQMQEEELRVKSEPVQWWDVCRRVDWLEREECINGIAPCGQKAAAMVMDTLDYEDNDTGENDLVKPHEHSHNDTGEI